MPSIADRVTLFNRAFDMAWRDLANEMLRDRQHAARRLSELIQREIKAGVDTPGAIAQLAVEQLRTERL